MDIIEKLAESIKEGERMATSNLAAKILISLDPHNRDPRVQRIVKEAIDEVWEQRGLEY